MEAKSKPRTVVAVVPQLPPGLQQQLSPLKGTTTTTAAPTKQRKPSALANRSDHRQPAKPKHTVKFKEQGDQEILVVTVEPPSSPSPAVYPGSPSSKQHCQLPALTTSESSDRPTTAVHGTPYPSATGAGGIRRREKVKSTEQSRCKSAKKSSPKGGLPPASAASSSSSHGHQRLSEGCTTLMYACQQGLTEEIVKELREKVRAIVCFPFFF